VLDRLYQSGPLRARLPRREAGSRTSAILLNTAGGVVAGDHLDVAVMAGKGTACTITTQSAERIYRAPPDAPPARIGTTLTIAAGATVEYLPQETIIFDNSAMTRNLAIDMAADASFLGVESLIFGRAAMGEDVHHARISDTITLRRDGALLFRDALRLPEHVAEALNRPAIGNGARALATVSLVSDQAERQIDAVRSALCNAEAGASAWNGMLLVRILAANGAALRQVVTAVLAVLRDGRALPRVWSC
jgi:urease accessory protein